MKQKRNIQAFPGIGRVLVILGLIVLAASCSQDDPGDVIPPVGALDDGTVTLEVSIPGVKTPSTYAMTASDENRIGELTVLAYKDISGVEQLQHKVVAQPADITNDGAGNMKVRFSLAAGDYHRLVVVANADSRVTALAAGSPLSSLQALEYTQAGKWDVATPKLIPMYGQTVAGTVNGLKVQQGVSKTFSNLKLIRMLARVDIRNQAAGFSLTKIHVYRANTGGRIAYNANYSAAVPGANLPGTVTSNKLENLYENASGLSSGGAIERQIYLFEAAAPAAGTIGTAGIRIVVEGKFNSNTYYYPVDFTYNGDKAGTTKGNFMPVVRNHQYVFTISRVIGPGFATADLAAASGEVFTNADVKVLVFDQDFSDVYFNGKNFLAVNTTGVEIRMGPEAYSTSRDENTISVLTDAATFTVECYDNSTGLLAASTKMRSEAPSYTGGSISKPFLVANYATNSLATEFHGYLIVKAGGLQSDRIPVNRWWCGKDGIPLKVDIGGGRGSYLTHLFPTGTGGAMQCWMVENLRYGSKGTGATNASALYYGDGGTIDSSWPYTGPGPNNSYYYTWTQGTNACPSGTGATGWVLPNQTEWTNLQTAANANWTTGTLAYKPFWGTNTASVSSLAGRFYNGGIAAYQFWYVWTNSGWWWSSGGSGQYFSAHSSMVTGPATVTIRDWHAVRCVRR